jgi:hypothetical protein
VRPNAISKGCRLGHAARWLSPRPGLVWEERLDGSPLEIGEFISRESCP